LAGSAGTVRSVVRAAKRGGRGGRFGYSKIMKGTKRQRTLDGDDSNRDSSESRSSADDSLGPVSESFLKGGIEERFSMRNIVKGKI
jgi:hypothetical protein